MKEVKTHVMQRQREKELGKEGMNIKVVPSLLKAHNDFGEAQKERKKERKTYGILRNPQAQKQNNDANDMEHVTS